MPCVFTETRRRGPEVGSLVMSGKWDRQAPPCARTRAGEELRRVEIPSRFTHDVVRADDKVYVCDTGNGRILEYDFPAMTLVGDAGCRRGAAWFRRRQMGGLGSTAASAAASGSWVRDGRAQ